jgi:hypothetical protein
LSFSAEFWKWQTSPIFTARACLLDRRLDEDVRNARRGELQLVQVRYRERSAIIVSQRLSCLTIAWKTVPHRSNLTSLFSRYEIFPERQNAVER